MIQKLIEILKNEKAGKEKNSFYHFLQLYFGYNSNKIEGSTLTEEQTELLFSHSAVFPQEGKIDVNDIIEMKNHFRMLDFLIDTLDEPISTTYIKKIHAILKRGTRDEDLGYPIGEYKIKENVIMSAVGQQRTCRVKEVANKMEELLNRFNSIEIMSLTDIITFHVEFEQIHPFQDGNGRVGRAVMFKQCIQYGLIPFVISDKMKTFYLRGLREWGSEKGFLTDTCLFAQDEFSKQFQEYLENFE